MTFETNKYLVIKNAISNELANFVYDYFLLKRNVASTLFDRQWISPFEQMHGHWQDSQIPNTYSIYGDPVMETLLIKVLPEMEKQTNLKLIPTYSYARIYKKGDELKRHKDRPSCEISTTLNLGGDSWPIFLEPSGNQGMKGEQINLEPGDMLIYRGCDLEHWREPFAGNVCGQVFLHYNNFATQGEKNKFDGRPHLGLPKEINVK
tara:strand:+ start:2748 stop:3365 length:618 start_codon:yes stop_codon:yes gene_type:complete